MASIHVYFIAYMQQSKNIEYFIFKKRYLLEIAFSNSLKIILNIIL